MRNFLKATAKVAQQGVGLGAALLAAGFLIVTFGPLALIGRYVDR